MINKALIGYTGFIGSNLVTQCKFEQVYNSINISEIENQDIELAICAGVSAIKWFANQNPETDRANIETLKSHISKANIKHLVLISTIDIYDTPLAVDEDAIPNIIKQDYYGKHRYQLEQWVAQRMSPDTYNILRLPGLFGENIKKNLIFDILNPLPKSLNKDLLHELEAKAASTDLAKIHASFTEDKTGNLTQNHDLNPKEKKELVEIFANLGFSALNFTDSRSVFQFYNMARLWSDIRKAINNNYHIFNLSSEQIMADELVKFVTGNNFENITTNGKAEYNMYSKYAADGKYLYHKQEILKEIKQFVESNK